MGEYIPLLGIYIALLGVYVALLGVYIARWIGITAAAASGPVESIHGVYRALLVACWALLIRSTTAPANMSDAAFVRPY